MMDSSLYYDASGSVLNEADEFTFARSRALQRAVRDNPCFALIDRLSTSDANGVKSEHLVVDVKCDGVPGANQYGIEFEERLEIRVAHDTNKLVEVRTLRRAFPVLMHQNQTAIGEPNSLCLYFEPPAVVSSTWTAQAFLRRIVWWIENSAKGTLHPIDQPVEQIFFDSKGEIVLPAGFQSSASKGHVNFVVERVSERPDEGITILVAEKNERNKDDKHRINLLYAITDPVVHGVVRRSPSTLGEFVELFGDKGTDLVREFRQQLAKLADPQNGMAKNAKVAEGYVFLVTIPCCRSEGAEPERYDSKAFLLIGDVLEAGIAVSAYVEHDGAYFNDVMGSLDTSTDAKWRAVKIAQMAVLYSNSRESFRSQSGVESAGPKGTLVGVGALGSALINIWIRCGWGVWTVIDNDHIKPHNLTRHTGYRLHIGNPKVHVVKTLAELIGDEEKLVEAVYADAVDKLKAADGLLFSPTALVVDASTSLTYPRATSNHPDVARHISIFLTPNGNSSVLLAEDDARKIKLRTLESQYYRAVIRNDWGHLHLQNEAPSYWTGAGCRDISTSLPYSRVLAHASLLSEQVRHSAGAAEAVIKVWQQNPESGEISLHEIAASPEFELPFKDGLNLYFDQGLVDHLRALRSKSLPMETGGVLLGYYDFNIASVVIVDAFSAPSDSVSQPGSFERGIKNLEDFINEASRRTAQVVRYIGEWHSHPPGHSSQPSSDDILQLKFLAKKMAADGLPAISLIVGEADISILKRDDTHE